MSAQAIELYRSLVVVDSNEGRTTSQWIAAITGAAADPNGEQMHSLAQHLAACERAKTFLRARGYGNVGEAIDKMVRDVPLARGQ